MQSLQDLVQQLGWIDLSTLVILLVFFVMGLFRGLVWQLSRLLTLVVGFVVAGAYAGEVQSFLVRIWPSSEPFALFGAYFAIFFAAFLVLSLVAWLLSKLIRGLRLSAYDRLGGGVLGVATGGAVVVVLLTALYAFIPPTMGIIQAAERSRTKPAAVKTLRFLEDKLSLPFFKTVLKSLDDTQPAAQPAGETKPAAGEGSSGEKR